MNMNVLFVPVDCYVTIERLLEKKHTSFSDPEATEKLSRGRLGRATYRRLQ
jgi:hypothetical protein